MGRVVEHHMRLDLEEACGRQAGHHGQRVSCTDSTLAVGHNGEGTAGEYNWELT